MQHNTAEHIVDVEVTHRRVFVMNDCDEPTPEWLNVVKGVVVSENLLLKIYRETLLQNKILRVIKKSHVTKYLEMLAEIAEQKDDRNEFFEEFVKCMKLENVELLKSNTFKPGDEQISFKEYVDVPRASLIVQTTQKTMEVPQVQYIDQIVDLPVVMQCQIPAIQAVQKAVEVPQVQFLDRMDGILKTVFQDRIPQRTAEQLVDIPVPQVTEESLRCSMHSLRTALNSESWSRLLRPQQLPLDEEVMEKTTEVVKFSPQERVQNRTGRQIIDVPIPRVMEEIIEVETLPADNELSSKLDGGCAVQAPECEELQRLGDERLVAIRDIIKLPNDSDNLELFKEQDDDDNKKTSCLINIGRAQDDDTSLATDMKSHVSTIADPTEQQQHWHSNQQAMRREGEPGEEREKGRKDEGGRDQEGRRKEKERKPEVKKDVTDWTVVTRNRRQRKMVQIFVRVNGSKATPMEVNLTNDKVEDVMRRIQNDEDAYATMQGKVLRTSEKLKSCGVTDGCTIQVTSRMRGGGRHKDKKKGSEKKHTASAKGNKQKSAEEPKSDEGPAMIHMDEVLRRMEENEEFQKIIDWVSEVSEGEVQQKVQSYLAKIRMSWMSQEKFEHLEGGVWRAVEARRRRRRDEEQGQSTGQEQGKKDKQVHFGEEEPLEETQAESTDEQEVRTGRGSACLVQGIDEKCLTNETCRKGKGKGDGGKGEHGRKGGTGSKGALHVESSVMDEDQENMTAMTSEEKEKNYKEDVRKLVEIVQKEEMELEMMQKEEMEQEEQRGRVAPNMGAGGSHLQATSGPQEEEAEERRKTARRPRWADCEDDERKEEEEQETERERRQETKEKKEQEKEKETMPETGHKELTSEKPPGLEQWVKGEHEEEDEEQRRAQEAREEKRMAQEAHEEQRRAQKALEQRRAHEERKKEVKAQEERERLARKAKAQEEQEWQTRETEAPNEQGVQEREVDAQGGARKKSRSPGGARRRRRRNNARRER